MTGYLDEQELDQVHGAGPLAHADTRVPQYVDTMPAHRRIRANVTRSAFVAALVCLAALAWRFA